MPGENSCGAKLTVRVFISITFRDMHAEQEELMKVVFPELSERCADPRLHLINLDLCWEVNEEEAERRRSVFTFSKDYLSNTAVSGANFIRHPV